MQLHNNTDMSYNGGKQIQNPTVKNIFLQRQLEEQQKEIDRLKEIVNA